MGTDLEMNALRLRLDRLERCNRRWRVGGLAAIFGLALFVSIAAAGAPTVPNVVRAHAFEVLDGQGRQVAILNSELLLSRGERTLALSPETLSMFDKSGTFSAMILSSEELTMSGADGSLDLGVARDPVDLATLAKLGSPSAMPPDGPLLDLSASTGDTQMVPGKVQVGAEGSFQTVIGSVGLITPATGEAHQTSAASIVMFGNDKDRKIIWQAPY